MTTNKNGINVDFSTNKKGTHTHSKTLSRTQDYRRRKALGLVKPRKVGQEVNSLIQKSKNKPEAMKEFLLSKNGNYKPRAKKAKKVGFFRKIWNLITAPFRVVLWVVKFFLKLIRTIIYVIVAVIFLLALLLISAISMTSMDDILCKLGEFGIQNKLDKLRAKNPVVEVKTRAQMLEDIKRGNRATRRLLDGKTKTK